ncbi:MAG TPA: SDR family NAD(P)-dependent oxidoreductase [Chloroflexi bacterium]|nr:SDR family NAD(P)-dependent oxidoreductase [Chloroflexota bacterium]
MKVFITGGAGFIGCNLANHHLRQGHQVIIFDNLSRKGTATNLAWLQENYDDKLTFIRGDIRDFDALQTAVPSDMDRLYHMAGQVAVTTSVVDPREDFEINALGTFNVLEAVRTIAPHAIVFYASTNKVYGSMEGIAVVEEEKRYRYSDLPFGISEEQPLDFHSPYGCSKGCGDQYVRDYARIYGLRTVVFRQSCIYGTRQFGIEDQGWVAHFCIAARLGRQISIYGTGKQVRDVLWIDDLVAAYESAAAHIDIAAGQIYNIGGGPENTMSIWTEFGPLLEKLAGHPIPVTYSDWRPGDQPVYISDIRKAEQELGWHPLVSMPAGIERLWKWIDANPDLFD